MTDYHTCRECDGYRLNCGCDAKRQEENRLKWAAEAEENRVAEKAVRDFLDSYNMSLADREAIERVLQLAQRQISAVRGFAKLVN